MSKDLRLKSSSRKSLAAGESSSMNKVFQVFKFQSFQKFLEKCSSRKSLTAGEFLTMNKVSSFPNISKVSGESSSRKSLVASESSSRNKFQSFPSFPKFLEKCSNVEKVSTTSEIFFVNRVKFADKKVSEFISKFRPNYFQL